MDLFKDYTQEESKVIYTHLNTEYTNDNNIPDYIALRLAELHANGYSGKKDYNNVSASMFSMSMKQMLYTLDAIKSDSIKTIDVSIVFASVLGTNLHTLFLGKEEDRVFKKIGKWTLSAEADRIESPDGTNTNTIRFENGHVIDIKSTSTFMFKKFLADKDTFARIGTMSIEDMKVLAPTLFKYTIQISDYNWMYDLNKPTGYLDFIMINWTQMNLSELGERIQRQPINLFSKEELEAYIIGVLDRLDAYRESGFYPDCTEVEIYGVTHYEYKVVKYGKTRRVAGTKIHSTYESAALEQMNHAGTQVLETKKKSKSPNCIYCDHKDICEQGKGELGV
jgi:hypothetical protein